MELLLSFYFVATHNEIKESSLDHLAMSTIKRCQIQTELGSPDRYSGLWEPEPPKILFVDSMYAAQIRLVARNSGKVAQEDRKLVFDTT